LYVDTTIGQFKNLRKFEHRTGLKKHLVLVEKSELSLNNYHVFPQAFPTGNLTSHVVLSCLKKPA